MQTSASRSARVRSISLAALDRLLPQILDSISIARGQMLVDQLTKLVQDKQLNQLVLLAADIPPAGEANNTLANESVLLSEPRALTLLQHGSNQPDGPTSSTATVLFSGCVGPNDVGRVGFPAGSVDNVAVGQAMGAAIAEVMGSRGVQLIQWARDSDPGRSRGGTSDDLAAPPEIWASQLGFRRLAELVYLRKELDTVPENSSIAGNLQPETLRLVQANTSTTETRRATDWESLVDQTYIETLDCPELAEMLTTRDILDGYRASRSYSPDLWFEARRSSAPDCDLRSSNDDLVGCLILARHGSCAEPAMELVYMGVVPKHRGNGWGARLIDHACRIARSQGCGSVILAVDRRNRPARVTYEAAGFVPIVSEEVWGKRLSPVKNEASKTEST